MFSSYKFMLGSLFLSVFCVDAHVVPLVAQNIGAATHEELMTRTTLVAKIKEFQQLLGIEKTKISTTPQLSAEIIDLRKKLQGAIIELVKFDKLFHELNYSDAEVENFIGHVPFIPVNNNTSTYDYICSQEKALEQGFAESEQWLKDYEENITYQSSTSKSWFAQGKSFFNTSSKKIAAGLGSLGLVAACKMLYDYATNLDTSLQSDEPLIHIKDLLDLGKDIAIAQNQRGEDLPMNNVSDLKENLSVEIPHLQVESLAKVDSFAEQILPPKEEQAAILCGYDHKKIIAIALVGSVLCYVTYKTLHSYFNKPSFEELAQKYVYSTNETDLLVVKKQFLKALQKHGYTSLQDKKRAQKILENYSIA